MLYRQQVLIPDLEYILFNNISHNVLVRLNKYYNYYKYIKCHDLSNQVFNKLHFFTDFNYTYVKSLNLNGGYYICYINYGDDIIDYHKKPSNMFELNCNYANIKIITNYHKNCIKMKINNFTIKSTRCDYKLNCNNMFNAVVFKPNK